MIYTSSPQHIPIPILPLLLLLLLAVAFPIVASKPILGQGITQPCKSGGAIKFGIPWPKSTNPLKRLEVSIDGAPRNIELATSTNVVNVVNAQSDTAQSSGTRSGSCTTTNADALPWFRIDLGEIRDVHSIQIINKGSCCDTDVTNLRVYVNDVRGPASDPLSVTTSQHAFAFDDRTMCGTVPISRIQKDGSKSLTCGRRGRYLAITGQQNVALKLCDIKVFAIPKSEGAAEMTSASTSGRRPTTTSGGYLFKNFLQSSNVVTEVRSDGVKNRVDCPTGTEISFGFKIQATSDPALRNCVASNNGACTPGTTFCETEACGSTSTPAGDVTSLVYAVCAKKEIAWPPPSRSSILTNVGDGGASLIECPSGQVLAFGFGIQWSPYASGTSASRRCVLDNNRACPIGAQKCEQILCRSSVGNVENRDVSFMYGICVRSEELPYSATDLASTKSDGVTPASPSVACHGKRVAFGFGYQFTNVRDAASSLRWSKSRLPLDPALFLSLQKANIQFDDSQSQRLQTLQRVLFGGLVPVMKIDSSTGDCSPTKQNDVIATATSTDTALGSVCSLYDDATESSNALLSDWSSDSSKSISEQMITTILPTKSRVVSYSLRAPASNLDRAPLRWTIEALVDRDGSWSIVDNRYAETNAPAWFSSELRSFALSTGSMIHSYGWRISFHTVGGGDRVQLSHLQWYTHDVTRSTTSWPSMCGDVGTSSLSPEGARMVRAYDRGAAALAKDATNSDFVDQLFRSDVHDEVLRRHVINTFGAAKASSPSCSRQDHTHDTPGEDIIFSMTICLDSGYFDPTIDVVVGALNARTDFSIDVRAVDILGKETTLSGMKVETSGIGVPGAPTLNLVRPQGGQLEIGLQTTPLVDDGGITASSLEYTVFMSKRLDRLNRTLSPTSSPSSSTDAQPNFVEKLPNITIRGLLRSYDPAITSSYGRSSNSRMTDVRRAHVESRTRLAVGANTRERLLIDVDATTGAFKNLAVSSTASTTYVTYSGVTTDVVGDGGGISKTMERRFRDVGEGARDSGVRLGDKHAGFSVSTKDFTWTAWMYRSGGELDSTSSMHLVSDGKVDPGHALLLLDGATGRFATSMGGVTASSFDSTDGDAQWDGVNDVKWSTLSIGWHHVALSRTAALKSLTLFVDGVEGSTFTRGIKASYSVKSFMGPGYLSSVLNYRGYWRSVSLYDMALKQTEIASLRNSIVDALSSEGTDGAVSNIERCDVNDGNRCTGFHNGERSSPLDIFRSLASGAFQVGQRHIGSGDHSRVHLGGVNPCEQEGIETSLSTWVKLSTGAHTTQSGQSPGCIRTKRLTWVEQQCVSVGIDDDDVSYNEKTSCSSTCATNQWCSGAVTQQGICSTNSFVRGIEWKATQTAVHKACGLTSRPGAAAVNSWNDLEFGIRMDGTTLEMIENGLPVGTLAGSGDATLQLRVRGDHRVEYVVNGKVKQVSIRTITSFPLYVGVSFRTQTNTQRGRIQGIKWLTRFGATMNNARPTLEGEVIVLDSGPMEKQIDSSNFYNVRPDYVVNDDLFPRRPRVIPSSGKDIGPKIGDDYIARHYGTFNIPEAGDYKFCANAGAGYHSIGMDMVMIGGTQHPGPYGQTLVGYDAITTIPRHCTDVWAIQGPKVTSGKYTIDPDGAGGDSSFSVRCDFDTPGGPWTVVQRRVDNSVDFANTYQQYVDGFDGGGGTNLVGEEGNQWLGLKKIRELTSKSPMQLRISICKTDGLCLHAAYDRLQVGDAASEYKLESIGTFLGGGLGDGMSNNVGEKFQAKDSSSSCGADRKGGWWYKSTGCSGFSNPNGKHGTSGAMGTAWSTAQWSSHDSKDVKTVQILIKPVGDWKEVVSHVKKTDDSGGACKTLPSLTAGIHSVRFHVSATVPAKPEFDCDIRKSDGNPDRTACETGIDAKILCQWETSTTVWSSGQCVPLSSGIRYQKVGGAGTLGQLNYMPTSRFHHSLATSSGGANPGDINQNGINGGHLLTSEYEGDRSAAVSEHKEGTIGLMVYDEKVVDIANAETNPWMHVTTSLVSVGEDNVGTGRQVYVNKIYKDGHPTNVDAIVSPFGGAGTIRVMRSGTTTFYTAPRTWRAASEPTLYSGDLRRASDGRLCVDEAGATGAAKCQHTEWMLAYDDNDRSKTYHSVITNGWSKLRVMSFVSTDHDNKYNYDTQSDSDCSAEPSSCRQLHGPFDTNQQTVTKTLSNLQGHDTIRISMRFWFVDQQGRTGSLKVDGVEVWSGTRPVDCVRHTSTFSPYERKIWFPEGSVAEAKKCYRQIDIDVEHTKKDITLSIKSDTNSNANNGWWGFDRVQVWTTSKTLTWCKTTGSDEGFSMCNLGHDGTTNTHRSCSNGAMSLYIGGGVAGKRHLLPNFGFRLGAVHVHQGVTLNAAEIRANYLALADRYSGTYLWSAAKENRCNIPSDQDVSGSSVDPEMYGVVEKFGSNRGIIQITSDVDGDPLQLSTPYYFVLQSHDRRGAKDVLSSISPIYRIATTTATPPGVPTNLKEIVGNIAFGTGDSKIVQWRVPKNTGGAPISQCQVVVKSNVNSFVAFEGLNGAKNGPDDSVLQDYDLRMTGRLQLSVVYQVTVRCRNNANPNYSSTSEPLRVVVDKGFAPMAPGNVNIVARTGSSFTVTWDPPLDTGAVPMANYKLTLKGQSTTSKHIWREWTTSDANTRREVVSGLPSLSEYSLSIQSVNVAAACVGESITSESVTAFTTRPMVPDKSPKPTSDQTKMTGGTIDAYWVHPTLPSPLEVKSTRLFRELLPGETHYKDLTVRTSCYDNLAQCTTEGGWKSSFVDSATGAAKSGTSTPTFDILPEGKNVLYVPTQDSTMGNSVATFDQDITKSGWYDIFLKWPRFTVSQTQYLHTAGVPVRIGHDDGVSNEHIDQTMKHGQWVKVGTYRYQQGSRCTVAVRSDVLGSARLANTFVIVDGLRLEMFRPELIYSAGMSVGPWVRTW